MKHYKKVTYKSVLLFIFIGINFIVGSAHQQQTDYYTRGKQAASEGNFVEALNIWLQAKGNLETPNTRIGIAFIELAAREKLEDYYELATLMYQWGLSAKDLSNSKKVLEDELERLSVLIDYRTYKRWRDLCKNNDPLIYKELSNFWELLDPTPTTGYNERLIEHWERIAYSQKHFNRSKSGVFKADDRAEIYVRYGKPDLKKSGFLQFNSTTAAAYIEDIANTPYIPVPKVSRTLIETYVQNAKNYHTRPEYEIWVYQENSSGSEKIIFIFGNDGNSGEFGLVESVEDFIPNAAFSMSERTQPGWGGVGNPRVDNIRPGLILQIVYYDQLSTANYFFGNMFETITSRAVDFGAPVSISLGQEMQNKARFELIRRKEKAARHESVYNKQMADIPIRIYQYRLLDEQNRPYFATFVESNPQKAFWVDYLSNYSRQDKNIPKDKIGQEQKLKQYEYTQAVQVYDKNNEMVTQLRNTPVIAANEGSSSASLFEIPAVAEGARQVFSAKLENSDPASKYVVEETPFPETLRGIGKIKVEQPAPLANDKDQLQMGDIILGYQFNNSAKGSNLFPFIVANDRKIPAREDLIVHFEVYHLNEGVDGEKHLTFSYEIIPEGNILDWFRKQKQDLEVTLNLETYDSRYIENLQIKTRVLKAGMYELNVVIQDQRTQEKVERSFDFEVVESN